MVFQRIYGIRLCCVVWYFTWILMNGQLFRISSLFPWISWIEQREMLFVFQNLRVREKYFHEKTWYFEMWNKYRNSWWIPNKNVLKYIETYTYWIQLNCRTKIFVKFLDFCEKKTILLLIRQYKFILLRNVTFLFKKILKPF